MEKDGLIARKAWRDRGKAGERVACVGRMTPYRSGADPKMDINGYGIEILGSGRTPVIANPGNAAAQSDGKVNGVKWELAFGLLGQNGLTTKQLPKASSQIHPNRTQPMIPTSNSFFSPEKVTLFQRAFGRQVILPSLAVSLGLLLLGLGSGCQSPGEAMTPSQIAEQNAAAKASDVLQIREGDVLKISFPGAANLDSTQPVRRDGRITLGVVGEVVAAGLSPKDLEKHLAELFSSQLVSKEVTVTVVSSTFTVFVNGAVLRPGKIVSDHPITALEAVMEAGGFNNASANMKGVTIVRTENGQTKNYVLDLAAVLQGKQSEQFFLKPGDIVLVPEKFSWL